MKMTQEIMSRLDAIAAKFGETANYFWPKMVENQIIEGWFKILGPCILMLIAFAILFIGYNLQKANKYETDDSGISITIIGTIIGIIAFILVVGFIPEGILVLNNPEVYALQELLEMF